MATMEPSTSSQFVIEYDANKNPVHSVTVFQTDRAEVNRKITVNLQEGQNDVEVKNLPTCLIEDSIRVDGIGNATIFDVIYHPPPAYDHSQHDESFADLRARQRKVKAQLEILKQQTDVLKEYSKTLNAASVDSAKLESFLEVYSSRKNKIDDSTAVLSEQLSALQKEENEKRKAVDADEESIRKRGTRVTIIVSADSQGPVELSLTYVVSDASWTPQYDLRASVASDSKSQSAVSLHYRASISQRSGEDWTGVALTLSTASPLQGTKVPSLNPYWIGEKVRPVLKMAAPPRPIVAMARFASASVRRPVAEEEESDEDMGYALDSPMKKRTATVQDSPMVMAAPPSFFRARDSEATAGAVSTTFSIPGLSTIPSDSDDAQQTHKVSIAELSFDSVDLEWVTVPKEIPSVFLQCRVKNTSKYVLLGGQANVFLNGSFVAKSNIPHVSQQESFSCSLGVDPAIRVTYHPRTTKSRTAGNGLLTARTNHTMSEQKISVKNTRLAPVSKLIVREQIPVSRDAKIKVLLLEPKALQKDKENVLKEGISVRWTNWKAVENGDLSSLSSEGLDMESAQGMLEWVCTIEPSSTADLSLSWEISAPTGVEWAKQ